VAISWHDEYAVRLVPDHRGERQRFSERTGISKYLRMSHDPQKTAQDKFRHAIGSVTIEQLPQPMRTYAVLIRIAAVRMDENVDVREDQRDDSMRSSNAAESLRSTPGCTPRPPTVGSFTGRRFPDALTGPRLCRRASSTTAVKVRPVSAARRLAAAMSWSSRRIVVRICHNI